MLARFLLNLLLLVIVAALAWTVWKNYKTEEHASQPVRIAYLEADEVDRIQILHKQRFIELVKEQQVWRMKTPIDIRANDFRIRTLLRMLDSSSHADYDASELDLAKYGLQQPQTRIHFNDLSIAFGIRNPVNGYRYVLVNDRVHLVEDAFYPLLSAQLGALVALEMLPAEARITWMQLPETELVRDENGTWSSDSGLTADEINETLSAWKNTQAFGVHDFMPRDRLGYASVKINGRQQPIEFVVTDTDPWLIIARPELGLEYHFNVEHYDTLLRPGAAGDLATDLPADVRQDILEALEQDPTQRPMPMDAEQDIDLDTDSLNMDTYIDTDVKPDTKPELHTDTETETETETDAAGDTGMNEEEQDSGVMIYLRDPATRDRNVNPADPSGGEQPGAQEDPW